MINKNKFRSGHNDCESKKVVTGRKWFYLKQWTCCLFVCLESLYIKIITIVMFQRDLQRERQSVQDLQHGGKIISLLKYYDCMHC